MSERRAILTVGLGLGDEGKGSLVDYVVRESGAHTVVRYNGGAQAAHNVIDPRGRRHTFAQFGSGTFVSGARTHLSRYMLVEPLSLLKEEEHLRRLGIYDGLARLTIDRRALITTPYHQAANRLREMARGDAHHGSCGRGIGETMADYLTYQERVLFAGDLASRTTLLEKLKFIREEKLASLREVIPLLPGTEYVQKELNVLTDAAYDEFCVDAYLAFAKRIRLVDDAFFRQLLAAEGTIIFEGAQGALLDENFGFHPFTTWSTTTLLNAAQLLSEQGYTGHIVRLGVLRAYGTRHGPGPFVTEEPRLACTIPDKHNGTNAWQHAFRIGYLDLVAARYALDITGGVDYLAVTNLDRLAQLAEWKVCSAYNCRSNPNGKLADYFGLGAGKEITGLKAKRTPDLHYQAELTRLLFQCEPRYEIYERGDGKEVNLSAYLDLLETRLGVPVAITSSGPTAIDKRAREVWREQVE